MQPAKHTIITERSFTGAPPQSTAHKSLYGVTLNDPVKGRQLLDSTRLHTDPGGRGDPPTSGISAAQSVTRDKTNLKTGSYTYSAALRSGLSVEKFSKKEEVKHTVPNLIKTTAQDDLGWQEVRSKKQTSCRVPPDSNTVTSDSERQYGSKYFPRAPQATPVKRAPSAGEQRLTVGKKSVKKPPGPTASSLQGCNQPKDAVYPLHRDPLFVRLTEVKLEYLQTCWQALGFSSQKGPIKRDRFIKALEAIGFKFRNGDGAQVSYKPPDDLKNHHALTLHLPHVY
ncbi:hypothetical protein OPQ81_005102 [Rhizoctonia solani]|nr:hypothetical protein OPQ81_005102 [Rhizoctonia solani]